MSDTQGAEPAPSATKPGYTTTEFWQTLFVSVLAAVVALGTLWRNGFDLSGVQSLVPALAVIAAAIGQAVYSRSRAAVKVAVIQQPDQG